MAEMKRICRTAASSVTQRKLYIWMLQRRLISYDELREIFKAYATPEVQKHLFPEFSYRLPRPQSDWGQMYDPFQPIDTAYYPAVLSPLNRLFIVQFVEYVSAKMIFGIPLPLIFTSPATKYETWKMDKEYTDLSKASKRLEKTVEDIKQRNSLKDPPAAHGLKRRAKRLRSRGFGSGLREVISVDEEWPEEGWATSMLLPDASYDVKLRYKMREKGRPFLLNIDPTDRSGIIPKSRVSKMLKLN